MGEYDAEPIEVRRGRGHTPSVEIPVWLIASGVSHAALAFYLHLAVAVHEDISVSEVGRRAGLDDVAPHLQALERIGAVEKIEGPDGETFVSIHFYPPEHSGR